MNDIFIKKADRIAGFGLWLFITYTILLSGLFVFRVDSSVIGIAITVLSFIGWGIKIIESRYLRRALGLPT